MFEFICFIFFFIDSSNKMQPSKAYLPISVTLSGIFTFVSPVQPENALKPISVTLSGIFTFVNPVQLIKPSSTFKPLFSVTLVNPVQFMNASLSIVITLAGIIMFVNPVQPSNAYSPIFITPLPIVRLFSPVQPPDTLTGFIKTRSSTCTSAICGLRYSVPFRAIYPFPLTAFIHYSNLYWL